MEQVVNRVIETVISNIFFSASRNYNTYVQIQCLQAENGLLQAKPYFWSHVLFFLSFDVTYLRQIK